MFRRPAHDGFRYAWADDRNLSAGFKQVCNFTLRHGAAADHQGASPVHFENYWKVAHRSFPNSVQFLANSTRGIHRRQTARLQLRAWLQFTLIEKFFQPFDDRRVRQFSIHIKQIGQEKSRSDRSLGRIRRVWEYLPQSRPAGEADAPTSPPMADIRDP